MGRRYLETELRTATPVQIVTRLYAAAIRDTHAAIEADGAGDFGERGRRISRVLAIVGELRGAIDLEQGEEIAANLDALYQFVGERLLEANRDNENVAGALDDVLQVMKPLDEAWREIEKRPDLETGSNP